MTTLSDVLVAAFLTNAQLIKQFPELKASADGFIKARDNSPRSGCNCKRKSTTSTVLAHARQTVASLPDARLKELRIAAGINDTLRVIYRDASGIKVKLV